MINRIKEIYEYRQMVYALVKKELRGRYQRSFLGMLWTLINPLFQVLIYTIVFSFLFKSNIDNYSVHLIVALIPWMFFTESVASGANSIVGNPDLVKKIYFPREVLVISIVTSKFINMIISFVIVFLFIFISGIKLSFLALLFLPFVMLIEYFLTLGVLLCISSICVYFRDMEYISVILTQALVWMAPIMYSVNILEGLVLKLIYLNPFTPIIVAYRDILYYGNTPDLKQLMITFACSIIILVVGENIFLKLEPDFAEEL